MQTSTIENQGKTKKGLKGKDIITLAIFSVLFVAICFIGIMISSALVVTQPFGLALAALLGGPMYMYMRVKVPAFGGVLITGVILSAAMFLTGGGWVITLCTLAASVIAELIGFASRYGSFWASAAGYALFMMIYAAGSYVPMFLMKEETLALAQSNNLDNTFMVDLLNFVTGPILAIALAAAGVCAVLGALLARTMMKKHFKKAGML